MHRTVVDLLTPIDGFDLCPVASRTVVDLLTPIDGSGLCPVATVHWTQAPLPIDKLYLLHLSLRKCSYK